MRYVVAVILGLMSGFLIYLIAGMVFAPVESGPTGTFVASFFLGGWAASTYLMARHTQTTGRVVKRGTLIGAIEWLLVIPAGAVMSGRVASTLDATTDAERASVAIGGGMFATITGAIAFVMAVICLVFYAVAHFSSRELTPERAGPTKKCPECAELVQAEARKCRYCGAIFDATTRI